MLSRWCLPIGLEKGASLPVATCMFTQSTKVLQAFRIFSVDPACTQKKLEPAILWARCVTVVLVLLCAWGWSYNYFISPATRQLLPIYVFYITLNSTLVNTGNMPVLCNGPGVYMIRGWLSGCGFNEPCTYIIGDWLGKWIKNKTR